MAGRITLGGPGGGGARPTAKSSKSGGGSLGKSDKIKIGVAAIALLLGGALAAWNFGVFDKWREPATDRPENIYQGGKPPDPETAARNEEIRQQQLERNAQLEKELGPPAGS